MIDYILPFLVILTVLVFVHELGHFWVARRNGVRVETFSIGFGPEIAGFTDRSGTRWKLGALPLGGYVKMFGDAGAASTPGDDLHSMTDEEKAVAFHHKRLSQRAAIVVAGPVANFLFAILFSTALFMTVGRPFTPPEVGSVIPDSAAARSGLQPGDRLLELDGSRIDSFEDIQRIIQLSPGEPLPARIQRGGATLSLVLTPDRQEETDRFGNVHVLGRLGIARGGLETVRLNPFEAVTAAVDHVFVTTGTILKVVGQMITGTRPADEIGGIVRIAHLSGEVSQIGMIAVINFMIMLSINLGLINLFPIPMLDGGHLLFYAIEAIRGRPLGERAQEYGFRIGFALVVCLMLFATWNDLVYFRVVHLVKQIAS